MARPRHAGEYQDGITAASRTGLAEIMAALGAYRDALVLIGGWAPHLILEAFREPGGYGTGIYGPGPFGGRFVHVGSIDIDLVVDPAIIERLEAGDRALFESLYAKMPRAEVLAPREEVLADLRGRGSAVTAEAVERVMRERAVRRLLGPMRLATYEARV